MVDVTVEARRFRVRMPHDDDHHGYVIAETDAHAAAVAWLERHSGLTQEASEVTVVVRDLETGHDQRFRLTVEASD